MGIMTRNLQPSTPCQHQARKQIEFQTIQNKNYESEAIPKPPGPRTSRYMFRPQDPCDRGGNDCDSAGRFAETAVGYEQREDTQGYTNPGV